MFSKLLFVILSISIVSACNHQTDDSAPASDASLNEEGVDVSYKVTFTSTWSATTHPESFPSGPHFSGLVGATHNMNVKLWESGELASQGIEVMAESGGKGDLESEVMTHIAIGDAYKTISEGGVGSSPATKEITITVNSDYSFVSLVTMLAPSPDWFVGVSALNLMESGIWLESKTVDLYVYDAGTDDGIAYTSANADSNPKQVIFKIEDAPFLVDGMVKPIGTMTFDKI